MKKFILLLILVTTFSNLYAQGKPYGGPPCDPGVSQSPPTDAHMILVNTIYIGKEHYEAYVGMTPDSMNIFKVALLDDLCKETIIYCDFLGEGRLNYLFGLSGAPGKYNFVIRYTLNSRVRLTDDNADIKKILIPLY